MPQIWEMPTASVPLTGLERVPMLQGGGVDAARGAPLLVTGAPFGGAVLLLDAPMVADMSGTADADPGAGGLRWNNADPHAATEIYVSDEDGEANPIVTALSALTIGGFVYVQGGGAMDATANLQRWQVTGRAAGAGYTKLAVSLQAGAGAFRDADALLVSVQQPVPSPGVDRNLVTDVASSAGVVTIDCALGDYVRLELDEDVTGWVLQNVPPACSILVRITQDATTRAVAWDSSFGWANGNAGVVSTGAGAIDVLALTTFDAGTTWQATLAQAFV